MSEKDLAARIGIARSTLQRIEKGAPVVEIGLVCEAVSWPWATRECAGGISGRGDGRGVH